MKRFLNAFVFATLLISNGICSGTDREPPSSTEVKLVRIDHEIRKVEGWTVHVDVSLLEGEYKDKGDLILKILAQRLFEISLRLPEKVVADLKKIPIYLDRNHPLGNAHYHPEADWLEQRGYDPAMGKAVQITHAGAIIREAKSPYSNSIVLHELAHAYHDSVLGFDHPDILSAYQKFCDSRQFDKIPHISGREAPHYGLTDHKEYFAEMTESFFTGNDFFPFNHYELFHAHRPTYDMLIRIWGSKMQPPQKRESDEMSILQLRILANLKSQRGQFEEAFALIDQAEARSSDEEGRLALLRKLVEKRSKEAKVETTEP